MADELNIGAMLKAHVKKYRLRQSGWARQEHLHRSTIGQYLKTKDMQIGTMLSICRALKYNFFRQIADMLPPDMPPIIQNPLQTRVEELERQNHDLQLQVNTLKEMVELFGKR